jgi:putative tricarboxylic transport membrane protein
VLLGGLLVHGLVPGPRLFEENGDVITGLYAGSFVATLSQLLVGIVILPVCIWLVNRPRPYLAAFIFALILSGVYTVHMSLFDLGIVLAAGVLGYFMRLFGYPFLPLVLGVVLGGLVESNYRRSLTLSGGDHVIFLEDPIAIVLLAIAALFVIGALAREWMPRRAKETSA